MKLVVWNQNYGTAAGEAVACEASTPHQTASFESLKVAEHGIMRCYFQIAQPWQLWPFMS